MTTALPPLLCTECGKPIESIGSAVALRLTVKYDSAVKEENDPRSPASKAEARAMLAALILGLVTGACLGVTVTVLIVML